MHGPECELKDWVECCDRKGKPCKRHKVVVSSSILDHNLHDKEKISDCHCEKGYVTNEVANYDECGHDELPCTNDYVL